MKIYDCFTFFNELDLLDIRLNLLDAYVDYFVLVEASQTHSGKDKSLVFHENNSRYTNFLHKIIYVCVDDFPKTGDSWVRENYQRNAIVRGLTDCGDNDLVIISDIDEIPNPATLEIMKKRGLVKPTSIPMFMCYYYANYIDMTHPFWIASRACKYGYLKKTTPQELREEHSSNYFEMAAITQLEENGCVNIGWHISFLGGVEKIKEKLTAYAHQEFNTEEFMASTYILTCISEGTDMFKRGRIFGLVDEKEFLPEYINSNYPQHIISIETLDNKRKRKSNKYLEKYKALSATAIVFKLFMSRAWQKKQTVKDGLRKYGLIRYTKRVIEKLFGR